MFRSVIRQSIPLILLPLLCGAGSVAFQIVGER
jgi:hypothetical protein